MGNRNGTDWIISEGIMRSVLLFPANSHLGGGLGMWRLEGDDGSSARADEWAWIGIGQTRARTNGWAIELSSLGWGIGKRSPLICFHGIIYRSLGIRSWPICVKLDQFLIKLPKSVPIFYWKEKAGRWQTKGIVRGLLCKERKTLFFVDLLYFAED